MTNVNNYSANNRTRLALFGTTLELLVTENISAIAVKAEDQALNVYPMTVKFVGKLRGVNDRTVMQIHRALAKQHAGGSIALGQRDVTQADE